MAESTDRRVRRTKLRIREAMTALLLEHELQDITVRELCERADISRGTFYLHYTDIYDLFSHIEQELISGFSQIVEQHHRTQRAQLMPTLLELFRYIGDNAQLCLALLQASQATFLEKIINMMRPKTSSEWVDVFSGIDPHDYDSCYEFVAYGCVAILKRWVMGGMEESPEQLAAMAGRLMAGAVDGVVTRK